MILRAPYTRRTLAGYQPSPPSAAALSSKSTVSPSKLHWLFIESCTTYGKYMSDRPSSGSTYIISGHNISQVGQSIGLVDVIEAIGVSNRNKSYLNKLISKLISLIDTMRIHICIISCIPRRLAPKPHWGNHFFLRQCLLALLLIMIKRKKMQLAKKIP